MSSRTYLIAALGLFMMAASTGASAREVSQINTNDCRVPVYRHDWETSEESGDVRLAFQIDAKGKVTAVKLVESSGWPDLDAASVRSLKQCVFKSAPASLNWEAVRYTWILK